MPIRISSSVDGFRRAGMAHPARPCTYPDDEFTAEQLAQLEAEPRLAVSRLQTDEVDQDDPANPAKGSEGALEPNGSPDDVTGHLEGVVNEDGVLMALEGMEEEGVRRIGKEMGIVSSHNMGLKKLIAKIKAERIPVAETGGA